MKTLLFASSIAALFLGGSALADPVAVGNASFQTDGTGTNFYPNTGSLNANATPGGSGANAGYYEEYVGLTATGNTSILGPDWSLSDTAAFNAGGWNLIEVDPAQTGSTPPNNRFLTAGTSDGSTYAFINLGSISNKASTTTITSTAASFSLNIQALTTYTLTIAVGNPSNTGASSAYEAPSPQEFIQFLANGNALNSTFFPLANVNVSSAPNGTFTDYTATFTTGATDTAGIFGDALALQMGATTTAVNASAQVGVGAFDNVRLDVSPAPEPSTWALMLVGLGGVVFLTRRFVKP